MPGDTAGFLWLLELSSAPPWDWLFGNGRRIGPDVCRVNMMLDCDSGKQLGGGVGMDKKEGLISWY